MAESLHRSSDTPNFDTHSASPPEGQTGQTGAEPSSSPRPSSERSSGERSSLEQHAAELGAAAGKVVVMARQTKETLESLTQHEIYERISDLAENAMARAEQLQHAASARTHELQQAAQLKAAELGRQAREKAAALSQQVKAGYFTARRRATKTVHDYPVQVAVAAGIIGFAIGAGLRIRRANRAYR